MSFWFPTDFGDEWQRKLLHLRASALLSVLLGAVIFATSTIHPFAPLPFLPAAWSLLDIYMRLFRTPPRLVITMAFELLATAFFACFVPLLVFHWMWSESNLVAFILFLLFACSLVCHGSIFLRTALQFLEVSRDQSRDFA